MPQPVLPPLTEWESFYVIVGSAAAGLTGLMFVVIALGAEARMLRGPEALEAFATPTIVHFGAVLLLSAYITTPRQTVRSLSDCLVVTGLVGLGYACWVVLHARLQEGYAPVLSDWIWHAGLPVVGYTCLFVSGFVLRRTPERALYLVEATALGLLFIGIHNAWDAVTYNVLVYTPKTEEPSGINDESEGIE